MIIAREENKKYRKSPSSGVSGVTERTITVIRPDSFMWSQDCCVSNTHEIHCKVNNIIYKEAPEVVSLLLACAPLLNTNTAKWCKPQMIKYWPNKSNKTTNQAVNSIIVFSGQELELFVSKSWRDWWNLDCIQIVLTWQSQLVMINITESSVTFYLLITFVTSFYIFPRMDVFMMLIVRFWQTR